MKPVDIAQFETGAGVRRRPFWLRALRGLLMAVLPLALLAGAVYGFKVMRDSRPPVPTRPAFERAFAVKAVEAAYSDYRPMLTLYGETRAGRKVDLKPLVSGEIVQVGPALREGGLVRKGDILIAIDRFDYEGAVTEASANLAEARARLKESLARVELEKKALVRASEQLELSVRDLQRAERLVENRTVSEKSADDRRMAVSTHELALEQRQSNLSIEAAKVDQQRAAITRLEWKLKQAERNLNDTVLRAPFDAHVRNVNAEVGRLASTSDTVATLLDANRIEVKFTLSDQQYGRLLADGEGIAGRPVAIRWKVGAEPLRFKGEIERVAAEINAETGGIEVFARVDLDDARAALRSGAFVEVEIADRAYENVVRLPESALYGSDAVYIIDVDERLSKRAVELLGYDGANVLVRGDLQEKDRVIATRISEIGDGLLVEEVE